MPQRQFLDSHGQTWTVWDVLPARVARDLDAAWLARQGLADVPGGDSQGRSRPTPPERFAEGWLCFETSGEKRRLSPVPAGWEHLCPTELESLRRRATPVGARGAPSHASASEQRQR